MTRIAIYADIHGELASLRSALSHASRLDCTRHLCLGDLVSEREPVEPIIELLRANDVTCIRGNHERWYLAGAAGEQLRYMPTPESFRWLGSLPAHLDLVVDGHRIAAHHARPGDDMEFLHPESKTRTELAALLVAANADVLLVGHTHRPWLVELPAGGLLANPGAVLSFPQTGSFGTPMIWDPDLGTFVPDDEPILGTFGVLDTKGPVFRVYDTDSGDEVSLP